MNVSFLLADKQVTPANAGSFGPRVSRARLDRIADAVLDAAEELRCTQHRPDGTIVCHGPDLDRLDFEVRACCPAFNEALAEHLRRHVMLADILAESPATVRPTGRARWRRFNWTFGPVLAGMIIDSVDLLTFGPLKRFLGFPLGAFAGFWMGSIFRLPMHQRLLCGLAAGVYCVIPGLEFIPLATLVGAYVRYRESSRMPVN